MRRLPLLLLLTSLPLALLCLLAVTSRWWFPGEIGANCSLHAALMLLPAVIVWRRSSTVAGGLLLCMLLGLSPWFRSAWEQRATLPSAEAPQIRVASANLYLYNHERTAAVASVMAQEADIVVMVESISSEDRAHVPVDRYPNQIWQPQPDRKWRDCVVLLSAYPIIWQQSYDLEVQPYLAATLDVKGRPLHVIAVHTVSPESPERTVERNDQLQRISQTIRQLQAANPAPVLLMGDWNLTVGSAAWHDLHQNGGVLRAAQREPSSWPWFLGPLGITIDHIMGRGLALGPQHAYIIRGSDHRGMSGSLQFLP